MVFQFIATPSEGLEYLSDRKRGFNRSAGPQILLTRLPFDYLDPTRTKLERGGSGQRLRCNRRASSSSDMSDPVSSPTRPPTRSTATERTCSACALESRGNPESEASRNTWNGYIRVTFDVTGTTVMTPRLRRDAVMFAPSLLTITAGRRLLASEPRTGSKSICRISPRSTSATARYRHPRPIPKLPPHRRNPTPPMLPRMPGQAPLPAAAEPLAEQRPT